MDFLANENFPVNSIWFIRNAGHDVASIIENTPGVKDYAGHRWVSPCSTQQNCTRLIAERSCHDKLPYSRHGRKRCGDNYLHRLRRNYLKRIIVPWCENAFIKILRLKDLDGVVDGENKHQMSLN